MPRSAAAAPAPSVDTVWLDFQNHKSQFCILAADAGVTERRIATTRSHFTMVLGGRPRARPPRGEHGNRTGGAPPRVGRPRGLPLLHDVLVDFWTMWGGNRLLRAALPCGGHLRGEPAPPRGRDATATSSAALRTTPTSDLRAQAHGSAGAGSAKRATARSSANATASAGIR